MAQMAQELGEHRSRASDAGDICQPLSTGSKDSPPEKEVQFETAAKNSCLPERKHHSEPLPQCGDSGEQGRKCFERRRLWSSVKQESIDLPNEFEYPTEDNVFTEGERSRQEWKGKLHYQRSFSVPATLPDIVPERQSMSENSSPDVVSVIEIPNPDHQPVKPILSGTSSVGTESLLEGREKKENFEGTVRCDQLPTAPDTKRRKSVTFETAVQMVRFMSPRGIEVRSHFRSSGYGSQSDNSQASQGSNVSSERGSIFSSADADDASLCTTITDGNIDNSEEEANRAETQEKPEKRENKQQVSPVDSKPQTPEEIDEIELWRRQNVPDFHCTGDMDDIPNLSIFETTKENSGLFYSDVHTGKFPGCGMNTSENPVREGHANHPMPSPQPMDKFPCIFEPCRDFRAPEGEGSENKSSPTTKEEIHRELYKRLFEEKMLKFDPSKESINDLFEWVRKNIGEALTPSPRSPFFTTEKSPQRISPDVAAATNTNNLCVPNVLGKPAALGNFPFIPIPPTAHQPNAQQVNSRPPGNRPAGVPLPQYPFPGFGMPLCPMMLNAAQQLKREALRPGDVVDGRDQERASNPGNQGNIPPARYQRDLPAILDDEMSSSVCIPSSSDVSVGSIDPSLVEQLELLSQCSYPGCTDVACMLGKKSLRSLEEALKRGPIHLSGEDLHLLHLLNEHYNTCELPSCPVPWCRYVFYRYPTRKEKTPQALMELLGSPLLTLLPESSECQFNVFVKMDDSLPGDRAPKEWEDWLTLCPLSPSFTVARVTPLLPIWPHKHWVVKVACLHEKRNQLEVYRKLRHLQHSHIVPHVWMAASYAAELVVVCTEFLPGVSMRTLLDQQGQLSEAQTCHYWKHILSATQHLHDLDIVFLNWTCENLLMDKRCDTVKLTNFVASVELSSGTADPGYIKLSLPADVVPAELLVQGGELTPKTDSWGLGCVLHEMLTGTRPWYHLRHCRQEDTWLQILKQVPPMLGSDLSPCAQLMIHHCLQKSPELRFSVRDMTDRCRSQWT
ncbi:uncharacterized protein LOC143298304 [Babylonia areolata]|uniref:uncharacterized protein LOC143298304 n=1 Tax=Babylonia areolata TaxID=304850 RepID=UPI003FD60A2C